MIVWMYKSKSCKSLFSLRASLIIVKLSQGRCWSLTRTWGHWDGGKQLQQCEDVWKALWAAFLQPVTQCLWSFFWEKWQPPGLPDMVIFWIRTMSVTDSHTVSQQWFLTSQQFCNCAKRLTVKIHQHFLLELSSLLCIAQSVHIQKRCPGSPLAT